MNDQAPATPASPAPDAAPAEAPATPPAAAPDAAPATPPADTPPAETPPAETPPAQILFDVEDDPETPPKDGAADPNPEGEGEKKEGEAEGDKPDFVSATIENLEIPDGFEVPDELRTQFDAMAKEHKLDAAQAQAMANIHMEILNKQVDSTLAMYDEWRSESENDEEIGGENLKPVAKRIDRMIQGVTKTPEEGVAIRAVLQQMGLGNNPNFLKVMHRISEKIADDRLGPTPPAGDGGKELSPGKRVYPNMT